MAPTPWLPTLEPSDFSFYDASQKAIFGFVHLKPENEVNESEPEKWPMSQLKIDLNLTEDQNYRLVYKVHFYHTVSLAHCKVVQRSESVFDIIRPLGGKPVKIYCDSLLSVNDWMSTLQAVIQVATKREQVLKEKRSSAIIASHEAVEPVQPTIHATVMPTEPADSSRSCAESEDDASGAHKKRKLDETAESHEVAEEQAGVETVEEKEGHTQFCLMFTDEGVLQRVPVTRKPGTVAFTFTPAPGGMKRLIAYVNSFRREDDTFQGAIWIAVKLWAHGTAFLLLDLFVLTPVQLWKDLVWSGWVAFKSVVWLLVRFAMIQLGLVLVVLAAAQREVV